jgi:hypothetical protein
MQPLKTKFSTSMGWPEFTYDRYQLGNIVGQGSYGDVFEALDTENKVVVAVKRMTKFRDSNSVEKTLFKLSREVRSANDLGIVCDGSNIIRDEGGGMFSFPNTATWSAGVSTPVDAGFSLHHSSI